ncbi:hypothetical protein PG994_006961 [Apiospora phragmitis]|uniref:Uncharacterized protein n=1 Tax=Apiospora phragmitis TaxID=2905665 RepID=A0ABR1VGI6_9PEZI
MKSSLPLSAMSLANIGTPRACLEQPPMQLVAGSSVQVSINNGLGKPCSASLVFTDDNFLPVVFSFGRLPCMGTQVAAFDIPIQAPNGDAYLFWKCAGQSAPTCTKAVITNGANNPELIASDQEGKMGCIQEGSSLLTSLFTSVSGSSTFVEPVVSTRQSLSTTFLDTNTHSTSTLGAHPTTWNQPSASMTTFSTMTTQSSSQMPPETTANSPQGPKVTSTASALPSASALSTFPDIMESNSDAILSTMLGHEIGFHNTTKYLLSQSDICCAAWKMAYEAASTDLLDTQLKLAESEEKLRAASAELQQLKTKTSHVLSARA